MLKVEKIIEIKPYKIVCLFNNSVKKELDVLPLIEKHKQLNGIDKLKDPTIFNMAKVGDFGQILWNDIIFNNKTNELWDYDISPEFIFYQTTE